MPDAYDVGKVIEVIVFPGWSLDGIEWIQIEILLGRNEGCVWTHQAHREEERAFRLGADKSTWNITLARQAQPLSSVNSRQHGEPGQ